VTDLLSPLRWLAVAAIDLGSLLVPTALVVARCVGTVVVGDLPRLDLAAVRRRRPRPPLPRNRAERRAAGDR
jgi:hypothetical protein